MKRLMSGLPRLGLLVALMTLGAQAAAPPGPFFNGFEQNIDGWLPGFDRDIVRKPSGYSNAGGYASGVPSAAGRWHARLVDLTGCMLQCDGPFTRWGGYSSTFPGGGYLTQLDIYLDVNWAATHPDARFDWLSAINQSTPPSPPTHRRDWAFNAGTQLIGDPVPGFWVNAATNSTRGSSFPENPCPSPADPISNPPAGCRAPVKITTSGWYTFRHTFRAGSFVGCPESTCLVVDFDIVNRSGATVAHWTIRSNQDPMSLVGGNRYGWFSNEEIPELAIDNSLRIGLCRQGHGDGEMHGHDSHKHKVHFHKKSPCNDRDDEDDNVQDDDEDNGSHFRSNAITASSFGVDEDSQTITIVGTGFHNGLPVGFTMMAVDNGSLAPGVFSLVLTDGYTVVGSLESGGIVIE